MYVIHVYYTLSSFTFIVTIDTFLPVSHIRLFVYIQSRSYHKEEV